MEWGRLTANFHAQGEALRGELFKRTFTARGIDPELPAFLKIEGSHWPFKEDGIIKSINNDIEKNQIIITMGAGNIWVQGESIINYLSR